MILINRRQVVMPAAMNANESNPVRVESLQCFAITDGNKRLLYHVCYELGKTIHILDPTLSSGTAYFVWKRRGREVRTAF